MKQRRYNNQQWLTKTSEAFWDDREKRKWCQFYNEKIRDILMELSLNEDENAQIFAKNLWHLAKADAEEISKELEEYKNYKKLQEDVQRMQALVYMNSYS